MKFSWISHLYVIKTIFYYLKILFYLTYYYYENDLAKIDNRKHFKTTRKEFRNNEKVDDPKVITVDLDETISHQGSFDFWSDDQTSVNKGYEKYINIGNNFYKDYKSAVNWRTTTMLPKYSEVGSKNINLCSSKFSSVISHQKNDSNMTIQVRHKKLSPRLHYKTHLHHYVHYFERSPYIFSFISLF